MRFNRLRFPLVLLVLITGGLFFTLVKKRQTLPPQTGQAGSESVSPETQPVSLANPNMDMTKEQLEKLKIQAEIELVKAKTELAKVEKEKVEAESTKLEMQIRLGQQQRR